MDNELTIKIGSSMLGACLGEVITFPICTLKTVYQTTNTPQPLSKFIPDFVKSRSFKGLYHGCQWATVSQMVAISSKYSAYEMIKKTRGTQQSDLMNNAINGCLGGVIGNFVSHPFDVLKNFRQRNEPILPVIQDPRILYRGLSRSMAKTCLVYSLLFPVLDFYQSHFNNVLISAPLATITTTVITHPIDHMKVRRIAGLPLTGNYYKGFGLNLARCLPNFVITICVIKYFERLKTTS
jgi:hypothetical protein